MKLELARIRAQGWALSEQQLDLNSRGIAVPLRDRHGDLVGALNITMPMGHEGSEDAVARVLPVLRETAQAMRGAALSPAQWPHAVAMAAAPDSIRPGAQTVSRSSQALRSARRPR